ncbi:MAG: PAS domain-containing protein [Clostridiaceae bacterium]|nr:PAS domain-containing protein [Clostridiaceae bacterium]MBW4859508.1 PAS domain-containing protein [Clostridiaceae bacterium]MBW4867353.1 PAS domain-containing protein [Clostridiaceae bacterium]
MDIVEEIKTGEINLPSGFFNIEELETLLNTLPVDITFVDANNKVRYFSENKNRVFPRTKTIIGRDVGDCHPRKSLDVVEQIVDDFRNGRKDTEIFYINKPGVFILIRYYALRNKDNKYLGVLEVTEEISELRKLEGSKTLLG